MRILGVVASGSLLVSIVGIGILEKGTNPEIETWFDVIWWWVVTSTTVGYGDIVPITEGGRVVAIVTIVSGFFVFTNLIALVVESTHRVIDRHRAGTAQIRLGGHILICEYTAIADELVQSLPRVPELLGYPVVIATDLVDHNPYPEHWFVRGVPINPTILRQANCAEAVMVFVFANLRFADPDTKTLHIASRVRAMNPDALIVVEIVDPQSELMRHAPKDLAVISSREAMRHVLDPAPFNPLNLLDAERKADFLARLPRPPLHEG
jgi:voltage-gated potassium channel